MTLQALPEAWPFTTPAAVEALTVVVHERLDDIEALWRELEIGPFCSVHNSYDWCKAWIATNPSRVAIVEGRIEGRTLFLLPLQIVEGHLARTGRFIASDYSNMNTGVFAEDVGILDPQAVARALQDALGDRVDLVILETMPLKWRDVMHPLSALGRTVNQNSAFQMPLKASLDETLNQVSGKRRRKKFRHQQRRMEEIGGYEILTARPGAEAHDLLEEFFRQKTMRLRSKGLPDSFREKPVQDFFHALLDLPSTENRYALQLRCVRLKDKNEGTVLAIEGLSRKDDHIICQFRSIRDDLFTETSPGDLMLWHIMEDACETGAAILDLGIGDQRYKRSWCAMETVHYDLLVPLTLRGRMAAAAHRATVGTKVMIKRNRSIYALLQRFRAASGRSTATDEASDGKTKRSSERAKGAVSS